MKQFKKTTELKFSKAKQTAHKRKKPVPKVTITEDQLQGQCNDTLNAYRIRWLRIPDWIWNWLIHNAPVRINKWMAERFGGMPDIVALEPVGDYNLALLLELKTERGKLHGNQKHWKGKQISRDPDTTILKVRNFLEEAKRLRDYYDRFPKDNTNRDA